jgi:hypothetical protein
MVRKRREEKTRIGNEGIEVIDTDIERSGTARAIEVSAEGTVMRMMRGRPIDIDRTGTDDDLGHCQSPDHARGLREEDQMMTEMIEDTSRGVTGETMSARAHVHLQEGETTMTTVETGSPHTQVRAARAPQTRDLAHHTDHEGKTPTTNAHDGSRQTTRILESPTHHFKKTREATKKQTAQPNSPPCSQMLHTWKQSANFDLPTLLPWMPNRGKRMTRSDQIAQDSLGVYGGRLKVLI